MCRAQSALPRPAPDEPNSHHHHHHRSRRHSPAHAAAQVRRDAPLAAVRRALGFGAAYDGRFGFDDTENLGGWREVTDIDLGESGRPKLRRRRPDRSRCLKLGLAPQARRFRGFARRCRSGRAAAGAEQRPWLRARAGWLGDDLSRVVPEPASSAVWPAASSAGAPPGFNSMLRGGESSAAMAAKLKAMTEWQMQSSIGTWGSLLWLGTASREARKASMLTVVSRRGSPPLQGEGSLKTSPGGRDLVARGRRGRS
jgi:hypothetical protein